MAQLDYVHSVLRLNYETLKGLISLASPSVAKTTLCETLLLASLYCRFCNLYRRFASDNISKCKQCAANAGVSAVDDSECNAC